MQAVKAWGTTMRAGLAATSAPAGGSGAPGPVGAGGALAEGSGAPGPAKAGGPLGTATLTHAQLMKLMDATVAKAAGGAAGAHAGGSSVSGLESQYKAAVEKSQGKRDGWSVDRSKQVRANVLAEGAKQQEALLRFRSEHLWKALEAHDFPEMVWARPMLEDEGCDIGELPTGSEASTEDWCVLAHLLRGRVTAMQVFARGKDPGATFEDVMDDSFARKRARSPSPPAAAKRVHFDPAVAAGGGGAALALTPGRRDDLAQAAAGLRTVTEEQLQQALNGTLTPDSVPTPAGEGAPRPVIPQHVGGALSGLDLRVYPGQNLDAQEKKSVLGEDGRSLQWETYNKRSRCSTLPEWERRFCFVMRKLIKFYEYLILQMEEDSSVTFERRPYSELLRGLRAGARAPRPYNDDRHPRGGKDKNGKNGPRNTPNAPRDANGEAPALGPVAGEGHEPEDGEEEDDVMSVASGFEFTPVEPSRGDYIEIEIEAIEEMAGDPRATPPASYAGADGGGGHVHEVLSMGAAVPFLTERAHLMAAAFEDWHDVDILVRGAACGIGWPSHPVEMDEPFRVPNYVALGMVEKVPDGKVKYRPVWDYSRPVDIGIDARIKLEKDKLSSVKDAYALLRPGYWMVKVDLDSVYRSVSVASQFWPAECFEFGGVCYMDARAPSGNRALPGIFMRGFSSLAASATRGAVRMTSPVLEDLAIIKEVVRRYHGRKVVLSREDVKEDFFATDSSGTKGMGGLMDERFFLHSWEDVRNMIQKPWFPFRKGMPESEHINYLELFAVCLFLTCVRYDIRLRPVYITTKDNKLADLLSRMQLQEFHMEHRAFMRASVQQFDGHQAWGNLPFSIMYGIIVNFLCCKKRQHMGTSGTFLVPVWGQERGRALDPTWVLILSLPEVFKVALLQEQKRYQEEALAGAPEEPTARGLGRFFGLFRKDNLTVSKEDACNSRTPLVRDDVLFTEDSETVWIRARYSKTIQCGERFHWVPLRRLPGSTLCLMWVLRARMRASAGRAGDYPLFMVEKGVGKKVQVVPLTHAGLVRGIKRFVEAAGLRPEMYSLRRGGATAAKRLEVHTM
ncbi:hypothetical protein CYMTET_46781 [Cymbomonas tetramitiformis]|uniref:Uncharacterized protein n=1 Tax=Cymbomonas tetramitiformis TaxID=36881 RepID=A0AAE0BVL9_9CHLO|nr:hypothetical protein CYMTET_46781 [Cymbomonas tetramitiformis]